LLRIFVILLLLILVACSSPAATSETSARHSIVYGLTLQPSGFDPHINASAELGIPLRQVYDTLVYRDPATAEFVPGLATNWTISPDGLVYTFTLRQGVQFHDGTPFNAQAVAANLDRITNPETASQKAVFMLGSYTGYEIVDDYTIHIRLGEPYSPLLDSFSQVYLGIASPAALSEYSANRYQFHQVGTGPFTMAEYVPGDRMVLRRNPAYSWGPAFYQPAAENSVDEVIFRFFTDPPTRALAIEGGEAQIIGELLPLDARALAANSEIQLVPANIPGQPMQFLMNTAKSPTDSRGVRQALLFTTNRNAIIDAVYQRFSPVAWGPLSASTLYYSRDMIGVYDHDSTQAQALLEAEGYEDTDNSGYLDRAGVDLEITMIVPPWGLIPEAAQLIQDQWRTLGIKVNIESVPTFNALIEAVEKGEYHLVAYNTFGLDPAFLNQFYMTNGINNWTGFSSAELDNILMEAARQTDPNLRRQLYAQAQFIIMDQALILPIRDYVNLNAAHTSIQNLTFDPYGWFPLLHNVSEQSAP
jgi:peptide/nickel transport system substrate-binding protein